MKAFATNKADILTVLPDEWPESLLPEIQEMVAASGRTLIVLDDDPTGTQTVHGIPVLTNWQLETLLRELQSDIPAFYILTNSRSMPLPAAQQLNREIGERLKEASEQARIPVVVVSRSDSTLRGHFPGETDALLEALQLEVDGTLVIPFFVEGGRYTINDVHWVAEGPQLIPAADTQFAQDAAFGYSHSDLKSWVEEKTAGRHRAEDIVTISLNDIREGGPQRVTEILLTLENGAVCVVNAASYSDMEVCVLGLLNAEVQGKKFLYRTAASFVRTRAGLSEKSLLSQADLGLSQEAGGLIVVGSYVNKTSTQLAHLLQYADIEPVVLDVEALLEGTDQAALTRTLAEQASDQLAAGRDVVIHTSRKLITGYDAASSLAIGSQVSAALVAIVRGITTRPRYILAKGGITSSDVATKGLNIERAMVLGQILPGVPVWQAGAASRFPNIPYIVFPGNVGTENSITGIVMGLTRHA